VQRITTHALLLGALLGVILLVIGLATIEPLFRALGADERTLPLIRDYMRPYYLGSVLFVLPMVGNFALRATGDARMPAIILSLSAIVNLILDPLLIFGLCGGCLDSSYRARQSRPFWRTPLRSWRR
jgi:Na+-driven multidrug efflux pump